MAQRTVFPAIPNTPDGSYIGTIQMLFQEIERQGADIAFKSFRPWLKERNIYDKEQVEELFFFLGSTYNPKITFGEFPVRFLQCETYEQHQQLLYQWVHAWNPFLTKYVFEALDVDGGGRLHSTHELYRLITSYVYAGEYVTLVNFQNWIKWMSASGYIKYIGIRWGLSELGKAEIKNLRMLDVDEMLEDEAEEAEAATEDSPVVELPAVPQIQETIAAIPSDTSAELESGDEAEELPDLPPEAPIPQWEPPADHPLADASKDLDENSSLDSGQPLNGTQDDAPEPRPSKQANDSASLKEKNPQSTGSGSAPTTVAKVEAWFAAYEGRCPDRAIDFGLEAKQYGSKPPLFVYKLAILAKLATGPLSPTVWEPLYRQLLSDGFFEDYFGGKRAVEALLEQYKWFEDDPRMRTAFATIAFDIMRGKTALRGQQGLCDQLEDAPDAPTVLALLQKNVFMGELTAAPFWMLREMGALGIWDNPALLTHAAVPTEVARANACRLGLLGSQYAYSFHALIDASAAIADHFPNGDYALHYVHDGLAPPSYRALQLPFREKA